MKACIVIPAYNEEKRIGTTLEDYSRYFESQRKKKLLDYQILVVINNTKDKTEDIVKKWKKKNSRIQYLNLVKGGKGYAVIEGFKEAMKGNFDLIGFVDADESTTPEAYYDLIANINGFGGAIASRYIPGAKVSPKQKLRRIVVSRIFNILVRILFMMPFKDTQCGAKVFKRDALKKILPDLSMTEWAFDIELLYSLKKKGYGILEVATTWSDKTYSKINFARAGPWMALGVIRLRLLNSPLRGVVSFYDRVIRYVPK